MKRLFKENHFLNLLESNKKSITHNVGSMYLDPKTTDVEKIATALVNQFILSAPKFDLNQKDVKTYMEEVPAHTLPGAYISRSGMVSRVVVIYIVKVQATSSRDVVFYSPTGYSLQEDFLAGYDDKFNLQVYYFSRYTSEILTDSQREDVKERGRKLYDTLNNLLPMIEKDCAKHNQDLLDHAVLEIRKQVDKNDKANKQNSELSNF